MSRKFLVIGGVLLVIFGLFIGFILFNNDDPSISNTGSNPEDYPLLARRIFTENPNEPIVNFSGLRSELNSYFEENNIEGGLYFEYLPTGTSIRIAGEEKEVAASLIKLPAAMELYKAAELGKINLDDEIVIREEWLDDGFGQLYKKGAGHKLTLREATKIMLKDSDNTALKTISVTMMGLVSESENPFNFLDAEFTQNPDLTVSISARSYSSFLKCLYFSCYLDKEHSQEILDYLSNTGFKDRIVAGVDDGVTVAHKVGNFGQTTQSDCGIVYLDKKNYLLCLMIEGPDNAETDAKIATISKLTYEFLKSK
jgi:beta-lactamase class A